MDEFSAAVYHQLPGIVCHADVGERFFDHLVDGSPGDGQVVVVARRRGHPGCRWLPERRSAPALTGSPSAPARGSSARGAGEGRAVPREATLRGAGGVDAADGRAGRAGGPLPGRRCAGPGRAARAQGSLGRGACHCRLHHILRAPAPPPYERPEESRAAKLPARSTVRLGALFPRRRRRQRRLARR